MTLNYREIGLILAELPLEGSVIQHVTQHDFHCLTWDLYHPKEGKWSLYTEIGTPSSRIHRISGKLSAVQGQKTAKLQRFVQFARRHLEGARIRAVHQAPYDRLVDLTLEGHGEAMHLVIRLYSGSQANIIVTDGSYRILDLLFRRPARGETSGATLVLPPEKTESDREFPVRPRVEGMSFNEQIEQEFARATNEVSLASLLERVVRKRDEEVHALEGTMKALSAKARANEPYERYKHEGDLLSAYKSTMDPAKGEVVVDDWETGRPLTITLDPKLSASGNIEAYYARYTKAKGTFHNAMEEYQRAKAQKAEAEARYAALLAPCDDERVMIRRLQKELAIQTVDKRTKTLPPGLTFHSGPFTIIVGRNAKENDELLRHWIKGYDYWMHTRDWPGGYVFIKGIKGKSVPLETLLDAGNLAVLYSKGKNQGAADLYYTQAKYLRRAKDGPLGLVLPTQEKNFFVKVDQARIARVMATKEGNDD